MPESAIRRPWLWVGAGFLFQALPGAIRDEALPVALKNAGLADARITQVAGILGLLVGFKLLWAPAVVRLGAPQRVISISQALIACLLFALGYAALGAQAGPWLLLGLLATLSLLSAGHDVALDGYYVAALEERERSRLAGLLNFASKMGSVLAGPCLIWLAGKLQADGSPAAEAWSTALLVAGLLAVLAWALTLWGLRREPVTALAPSQPLALTLRTLATDRRWPALLALILLYRTSEVHLARVLPLFSVAPIHEGGLGLNNETYATLRLTTGVGGLALGGLVGSAIVTRLGVRQSLVPLGIAMHLPLLGIAWLATHPNPSLPIIALAFAVEHVAYGAGVCALLLAMMKVAAGPHAAVRYATLSTVALIGAYLPGLWAGSAAQALGYDGYFVLILILAIPGVISAILARRVLD
jgi:PAT family beta-lactamase induction signal transducer AmpG